MLDDLGQKIREMREEQNITREELCGDEIELSVRQLARIESGQSIPTLAKVEYIAKCLGITVGVLTDGESMELPKRYKELKYLVLRTPTYMDDERVQLREEQFDEIFEEYYDRLPEVEQVTIDIIQSRFEVFNSGNIDFGTGILYEYFEQVKKKKLYHINDLALIDLYLMCSVASEFNSDLFDCDTYINFVERLLKQDKFVQIEDLSFLNSIVLVAAEIAVRLKLYDSLRKLLSYSHCLMMRIQDFQKMSLYNILEWEYALFYLRDKKKAEYYYSQALMFATMTGDGHLASKIEEEWLKDLENM